MELSDDRKPVNNPNDVDEFLATARRRYASCAESERTIRQEAQSDVLFRTGTQWSPTAKQIREDANRPCLTINRLPQFIHQVSNDLRKNSPSLSVVPVGDGADSDSAEIWQGLMRHIEVRSDAQAAYETAFDNAVGQSFGWYRVLTEYAQVDSFDQEIVIKPVLDSFSVYCDPSAVELDRSDMMFAFVRSTMSREEFKRKYAKTRMTEFAFYDMNVGDEPGQDWLTQDNVTICEYWVKELKSRKLQLIEAQLADPQDSTGILPKLREIFGDDIHANKTNDGRLSFAVFEDAYKGELPAGVKIIDTRDVDYPKVMWYKITATDVLEKTEWAGQYIPLIPVFGEQVVVNGRLQIHSLTRWIKDSQALYNYLRSQQAEIIALTPRVPWVGPVGSFKTHAQMWQKANNTNYANLEYDIVVGPNGQQAPPPQRNATEPPIQAVSQAVLQAADDLKAGTGIYNPSLGDQSNEVSGRAILARQSESDNSNFHFVDNFRRSMRYLGRILMDLIPHIYDRAERVVRIVKPNTDHEMVMINGPTMYKGKPIVFDPSVGIYDVVVEIGPSFNTKREQVFEMLSEFTKNNPALWSVVGDLIFKASPLPGDLPEQMSQRMKTTLSPQVQQLANGQQPLPPDVQAKMAQGQQIIQLLTQKVQQLDQVIKTKMLDIQSREKIAEMQDRTQIIVAEIQKDMANADRLAALDLVDLEHRLGIIDQVVDSQLNPPAPPGGGQ